MDNVIVRHFGEIQEGKLYIFDRKGFASRIAGMQNCRITIEIQKREGSLSHQMRKYYFGVLLKKLQDAFFAVGEEYDLETLDHTFRMKALYKETYNEESGKMQKEPHSLKDADTEVTVKMFMYYIEYIIRFAIVNLDWAIEFPNEIFNKQDLTDQQFNQIISKI